MNIATTLTPDELLDFLLHVAPVRPVFIWGPPGIGKSALVQQFAGDVGMPCVSLLGSQLAPEDLIGVPQISGDTSYFCPPRSIARKEPYVLFLDELNACSHEVQKAFYSLIHERRIGEYYLPEGSVVIGAGNRAQDSAIVKPMSSALLNRMVHIAVRADVRQWLDWAHQNQLHPLVTSYIQERPDHLWSQPPRHEEPFSTPRSWHALSDAMNSYPEPIPQRQLEILANGCLSPAHATQFRAYLKNLKNKYELNSIIKGDAGWPHKPEERDALYFLAQSFRARLVKDLPASRDGGGDAYRDLSHRAKNLIKSLAEISLEIAQLVVVETDGDKLPDWFMVEVVRDLPRIVERKDK